jgi:hypothetical protein
MRGIADEVSEIGAMVDRWSRRDAPDALAQRIAAQDAADLYAAAALLRRVANREDVIDFDG